MVAGSSPVACSLIIDNEHLSNTKADLTNQLYHCFIELESRLESCLLLRGFEYSLAFIGETK